MGHIESNVVPLKLGAEVIGMDLTRVTSKESIDIIKNLVTEHRLVVFRNQPPISGAEHARISRWFGDIDAESHPKHPKSPCDDVLRASNDPSEGFLEIGTLGWHIDGCRREKPYGYSLYYMPVVPKVGDTRFIGLTELLESLPKQQLERWNRLWMMTRDRGSPTVHPVVYPHPLTGKMISCFHLGRTDGFIQERGAPEERQLSGGERQTVLNEMFNAIVADGEALVYSHKWLPGDFIITDNLALGHQPSEESQWPPEKVGLRVLHRITVKGEYRPAK